MSQIEREGRWMRDKPIANTEIFKEVRVNPAYVLPLTNSSDKKLLHYSSLNPEG